LVVAVSMLPLLIVAIRDRRSLRVPAS
jgi:hypothetical protein